MHEPITLHSSSSQREKAIYVQSPPDYFGVLQTGRPILCIKVNEEGNEGELHCCVLLALISCGCCLGIYSHSVSFIYEVKIMERKIHNAGLSEVDRTSNAKAINKEIEFKGRSIKGEV